MRRLVLLAVLCACSGKQGVDPPRAGAGDRLAIAKLEAQRGGGVDELIARARTGDAATRDLAVRALGRAGGPRALDALIALLGDPSPAIANRAAASIGVLAALSDPPPAIIARTSPALVAMFDREDIDPAVVAEALGRAGDAAALAPLVARVTAKEPAVAAAAAAALLRFGRREVTLDAGAHAALITASTAGSADVRHAAVVALARELRGAPPAPADAAVTRALVAAIGDADGEVRATAIDGLRRHQAVAAGAAQIEQALQDADWRVAVQAAKALAGADGTDAGRDAVAVTLVRTWTVLAAGTAPSQAHVLLEGLRAIAPSAARPPVNAALVELQHLASGATPAGVTPLVRGWTHCLATAALERAAPEKFDRGARVMACGGDAIAPHLRAELVVGLLGAEVGAEPDRWAALEWLLIQDDTRTRAAGYAGVEPIAAKLSGLHQGLLVPHVVGGLQAKDAVEVGTAAEAARALLETDELKRSQAGRKRIVDALIARATTEQDPEVAGGLLDTIAQGKIAEGQAACEAGAKATSPVIRAGAGRCLTALAGAPADQRPFDEPAAAALPAADAATVLGKTVTWHVTTTRGELTIALEPDVAPWHVATIAALTENKFYDGLVFHRIVPDFVVQGGDPTGTGWGGPGFTLPAEPGSRLDGDSYAIGAVGIADAGKDSGGSQWFAMHSHAEYLEGRYTRIGRVTSGQEVVDAIVVGDAVIRATVEIR